MLIGTISRAGDEPWFARCDLIGAFTVGDSREDARDLLRSLVDLKVDHKGFRATVTELDEQPDGSIRVLISSNNETALAAGVLKHQREIHGLTVSEVAKRLGSKHPNSYSSYERAEREPSLSKYIELLSAIAPDVALTWSAERKPAKQARTTPAKRARSR